MSNFSKAFQVCLSLEMDDGDTPSAMDYVRTLRDAGLLAPDLRIIRTVEELEALNPDTVVMTSDNGEVYYVKSLTHIHVKSFLYVPAVVVASGAQVRAAREAMEQDNE